MPCKPKHIHRALRTDNAQQKFDPPSTCPGCSAMELPRTAPCKHQIAIRDNRTPPSAHQNAHKKVASPGADKNPKENRPPPPAPAPSPPRHRPPESFAPLHSLSFCRGRPFRAASRIVV